MTGRIKNYCLKSGVGAIETEDGVDAIFEIADVLTFDRVGLKPGKVVSFVVGSATPLRAYEIVVRTGINEPTDSTKSKDVEDLRYTGFLYESGSRVYSFEERVAGEETRQYRVVTEVDLLLKHHISLQDTPSLCLRVLRGKLLTHSIPEGLKHYRCLLGAGDIAAFLSLREPVKPRFYQRPKRILRGPAPAFGASYPPPLQTPASAPEGANNRNQPADRTFGARGALGGGVR